MKQLFLIGFMGSGKTTVARHLSKTLNMNYIDIDNLIEEMNYKISDIFREEGEDAFRSYETDALKLTRQALIISTGGGIVERRENIHFMKNNGIIIYLRTSLDIIKTRLANDKSRPLWKEGSQTDVLFSNRVKMYEACADYTIDCDNRSVEELVQEIIDICKYKGILEGEE
jgi:shikimate kinase